MSGVRIVLILTENWTMRPTPDVADLVQFAVEAERAGLDAVMVSEHVEVNKPPLTMLNAGGYGHPARDPACRTGPAGSRCPRCPRCPRRVPLPPLATRPRPPATT